MAVAHSNTGYACLMPFGFWLGLEIQAGVELFSREAGEHFYPMWINQHYTAADLSWVKGAVCFAATQSVIRQVEELNVPVINVSANLSDPVFPSVINDESSLAAVAVRTLVAGGARELIYVTLGQAGTGFRKSRREGLSAAAHELGCQVKVLSLPHQRRHAGDELNLEQACFHFLEQQQPPIFALMASASEVRYMARATSRLGWSFGREVAIIQLTDPRESNAFQSDPVSYIAHDWRQVGYRAASKLSHWVQTGTEPSALEVVPPLPPFLTESSDSTLTRDLAIRVASILRRSPDYGITVEEISRELGVSISSLYREVKKATGKSLQQHLVQRKMNEARRLLAVTDLPIQDIAVRCGYRNGHSLSYTFEKQFSCAPGEWRRREQKSRTE